MFHNPDRLETALTKRVLLFVRQSSRFQAINNLGSQDVQREQLRFLEPFGFQANQVRIETIEALGESGRVDADRPNFETLLQLVSSGEYGLLAAARSDRFGRNLLDADRLYDAASNRGVLIMLGPRIYDPSEPADRLMLGMQSNYAEYENAARTRWMMLARLARAKRGELRIALPTGLVWASPEDRAYVRALTDAGLAHWLERIPEHRASSIREGRRLFVLPFPDADLQRSVQLRLQWIQETGTLTGLVDRIQNSPEWPHPGKLPSCPRTFYVPDATVCWDFPTGDSPAAQAMCMRDSLRKWLLSPALYGVYAFQSRVQMHSRREGAVITLENWFPSFADSAARSVVQRLVSARAREDRQGGYEGPRDHALAVVYCSEAHNDRVCGYRMPAVYQAHGAATYSSAACVKKGHRPSSVSTVIDDAVLEIILSVFDSAALQRSIEAVRINAAAASGNRRQLEEKLHRLEERIEASRRKELDALEKSDFEEEEEWRTHRAELRVKRDQARAELKAAASDDDELRAATADDLKRIYALASNLPLLLKRARATPGRVRSIVRHLITAVHVRRISHFGVVLSVEFPTGERVDRVVFTTNSTTTQPERAYCYLRLERGDTAEAIASDLRSYGNRSWNEWTTARVRDSAMRHRHIPCTEIRDGAHLRTSALAVELGVAEDVLHSVLMVGVLGPVRIEEGELSVCATAVELHRHFPEYARREVAQVQGWPFDDTEPFAELQRERTEKVGLGSDPRIRSLDFILRLQSGIGADKSQRRWGRRSEAFRTAQELAGELAAREDAECEGLDVQYWTPVKDAMSVLRMGYRGILEHTRVARLSLDAQNSRTTFVWIAPEVVARLRPPPLAAVVAARYPTLDLTHFVRQPNLTRLIRERYGIDPSSLWEAATERGGVLRVRASAGTESGMASEYIYFPPHLRQGDVEQVRDWLLGPDTAPNSGAEERVSAR